jgi:hypothetical protein
VLALARVNSSVRRPIIVLILRAIVGGAIGGFAWIFLYPTLGGVGLRAVPWLVIGYIAFGLPIGAGIGGLVGVVIWLVNELGNAPLHYGFRLLIGVGIAFLILGIYFFTQGSFGDLTLRHLWYALYFSFAIGMTSGLMARRVIKPKAAEQIVGRERRERVS